MTDYTIGSWNIRGLNHLNKRDAKRRYTNKHKFSIFAILESRIQHSNVDEISRYFGNNWSIVTNVNMGRNIRIIVLWRAVEIELQVVNMSD